MCPSPLLSLVSAVPRALPHFGMFPLFCWLTKRSTPSYLKFPWCFPFHPHIYPRNRTAHLLKDRRHLQVTFVFLFVTFPFVLNFPTLFAPPQSLFDSDPFFFRFLRLRQTVFFPPPCFSRHSLITSQSRPLHFPFF